MALFVTLAALLAVAALAWATAPLWRQARVPGLAAVALLAVLAGTLYLVVGNPDALDPAKRRPPETLPEAIASLEEALERDPSQAEGWRLLARAYAAEARTNDARDAFARAVALAPDDADLLAEAAESRALASDNRRFDDTAIDLLQRALQVQPMHQRSRWFLGIAQRQRGQHAEAAATWEPLLAIVDPTTAAPLREQIDIARKEAGLSPLPAAVAAVPAPDTAAERGPGITVSVSLDPQLAMRLPEGAVVYVIARQTEGPPMPVAVERLPVSALPTVVTLDDGDSPMPTLKLSQLDTAEVVARVSASGDAAAQAGDFTSAPLHAAPGADSRVALLIDQVVR